MMAAVMHGGSRCSVETCDAAAPGPGEVLIQVEGCGICASTLPAWQGRPWFRYPLEPGSPGHEPWGRIVECGEGVSGFEVGSRVTGLSYQAHAEFDVASAAEVVALPHELDDKPFPGEALACAMNVFARSGIERGMSVAVVGAGFIGGMLIQVLTAAGATVTALSKRQWSLDRAVQQGAVAAHSVDDHPGGQGERWPCVIECTGTQDGLDIASKLVGVRGRLVVAGYHQEGLRSVNMQEWNWKGIDVINAHERDPARYVSGMQAALAAIREKHIDPWPLFTHRVPLLEVDRAFRLMDERPDGFTKAVLCP